MVTKRESTDAISESLNHEIAENKVLSNHEVRSPRRLRPLCLYDCDEEVWAPQAGLVSYWSADLGVAPVSH